MLDSRKISIINRLQTGVTFLNIKNSLYSMSVPTKEQHAISDLVYRETFEDSKYSDLITREQATNLLAKKGIWRPEDDDTLEHYNKSLESIKIELYEALYNEQKQKKLRRTIQSVKKGINKSLVKKYSLDHITLEHHAETARDEFLTAITIKDSYRNPVYTYDNWSKTDNYVLQRFLNFLQSNIITTEEFREIARTDPFRSRWSLLKTNVFDFEILTGEQTSLCMYCRMYDNVYEHPEKPTEQVIDDDDMLDGWFAKQRKQMEEDKQRKELEKVSGMDGNSNAGEMFIMANNSKDAKKISSVNTLDSKMKMRQRSAVLNKTGARIEEQHLPDVKQDLKSQAMKQMADRFKK